jgi:hypothetical protein
VALVTWLRKTCERYLIVVKEKAPELIQALLSPNQNIGQCILNIA